ncbi:MAG TPA: CopD family protein [Solirubrobacteraceae bacterium]
MVARIKHKEGLIVGRHYARTANEPLTRWRALPKRTLPKLILAVALMGVPLLAAPPAALAHAQLLGTSPLSGSTVPKQPAEVIFKFNQAVGGTLGAVRVYNAQGAEVDNLDVAHPEGKQHWMGVGLKPNLPDGTYTGTYRVISADTHIVYGGLVFSLGHAGAAPKFTVAGLIDRNKSGQVTEVAFGAVRGLDYASLALGLGGLAFLLWAWLPALSSVADAESGWPAASRAFAQRLWLLLIVAVVLGIVVSVLGILLQGASAAGVSLWASLKGTIVSDTLKSRFGEIWGLRGLVWVAFGALLVGARIRRHEEIPVLSATRPAAGVGGAREWEATATVGRVADGATVTAARATTFGSHSRRALLVVVGVGAAFLAMTPALSGHASVQSPTGVFFPIDVIHVLCASVWVGGIACLLLALPAATRQLEAPQRSRLLAATLARFSPLALACVIAIAATGVVQAYIDVRSFEGLFHTTYGALVIVKVVLLSALIGLGWVNRERVLPALQRLAGAGGSPGATGILARRTMRGELALMLVVFGVTAALVSYAPPIDAASGPFSINATLGPAELEMTVEPARVGVNTVHMYLIDAKTGTQFTATKELTVTAKLPTKGIGPLPLQSNLAGPGHYVLSSAELSPGGTWQLQILDRVSEFEEYEKTVSVPIR